MLRILLVDDHGILREAVVAQLSQCPDIESICQACDAAEALSLFDQERFDVVLMDVDMPGENAFETVQTMRLKDPSCKVMFLTGYDCDAYVKRALQIGANGYVLKRDGIAVLIEGIKTVVQSGCFFSASIDPRIGKGKDGRFELIRPRSDVVASLTPRENELLTHLGMGASLKEAAAAMSISYKTADNQKAKLMKKLGIHDRVELARFAIREGLVNCT